MRRVLHVMGAMNRGGAETMVMSCYRALDTSRLQFDFLEFSSARSDYADEIESLGGRVLKSSWSQDPRRVAQTVRNLAHVMKDHGPFLAVHSHALFASGTILAAAERAGVSVRLAHSHATRSGRLGAVSAFYRTVARSSIRRHSTRLAACSVDAGNFLFGERRFSESGVVIPNAVSTDEFFPGPAGSGAENREALGIPGGTLVLTSVARLDEVKNHGFLVELAHVLEARGIDFMMLFVGDGPLRSVLESSVRGSGLGHRVRLLGLREDIPMLLRATDIFLLPSFFEGVPVSLIEAQATGLRCLVSDTVGMEADLGLGLVTFKPIADVSVWADSIVTNLSSSAPTLDSIQFAMAERGYTVDSALRRMLSLYPGVGD